MKLSCTILSPVSSFVSKLIASTLICSLVGMETAMLAAGPAIRPVNGHSMMASPLSPQAIFQEALLFYLKRSMTAALPLELDPSKVLNTVSNAQLPGGAFHGRPLLLTAENVSRPLAPGDYEIPVMAYCTQYSVHRAGKGAATALAPVAGTQAETISNLLWRGTQAGVPPGRLQTTAWAIQAGLPYDRMSKQSQKDLDMFAPESRAESRQGFSIDAPVRQLYNEMVVNPRKLILAYKHEKGLNFPDFLIPNIKIAAPTFDQLVAQAGPIGREYVRAELEQESIQKTLNDQEHGQESLLLHQAPVDGQLPPSQGPWTVRVANTVYMRFIVNGGNMQANNVMQIRVLPSTGSYDDARLHTPRLINAAYQVMPLPVPVTVIGLMGGGALGSQLPKQKGISQKEYGSSSLGPIIAFPSIPAQALILVLPLLYGLQNPSSPTTQTRAVAKTKEAIPLYHYTFHRAALAIEAAGCQIATKAYDKTRGDGAYATDIAPTDHQWTQEELSRMFYGDDPSWDMSWYVEIDNEDENFRPLAYQGVKHEWVKNAPAGDCVPIKVLGVGPNSMRAR